MVVWGLSDESLRKSQKWTKRRPRLNWNIFVKSEISFAIYDKNYQRKNEVRRTILKFQISNGAGSYVLVNFPILGYFSHYFAWVILWPITSMRPGWKIGFVSKFRKKWKFWNILESNSGVRFWPFRVRKNNKKVKNFSLLR